MNRRIWGTAAAFLVSLAIAAGGLYVFRIGLKNREKAMLSEKGIVEQNLSQDQDNGDRSAAVSYAVTDTSLSEEELYQVLKNKEEALEYQPHEPYYGQLTIQQAVERGAGWLDKIREQNSALALPKELGEKVWANLARAGETEGFYVIDSNRILSSWDLNFYGQGITVDLRMNAVTGEVLEMEIIKEGSGITEEDGKKILESFISQFDFPKDGEIHREEDVLIQSFCKGRFFAIGEIFYNEIDMGIAESWIRVWMTTQKPGQ